MSAVIDKLAERQDQFIDLLVQWQKPVVAGLRRTASLLESQTARLDKLPGLPAIPGVGRLGNLPGVDRLGGFSLPTPEEILRNQFAFAERVLETNKRFALSLATLGETEPKAPAGTTAAAAAPKRTATAKPRRTAKRTSSAKPAARRPAARRSAEG